MAEGMPSLPAMASRADTTYRLVLGQDICGSRVAYVSKVRYFSLKNAPFSNHAVSKRRSKNTES
jgi:hypothetical protein